MFSPPMHELAIVNSGTPCLHAYIAAVLEARERTSVRRKKDGS